MPQTLMQKIYMFKLIRFLLICISLFSSFSANSAITQVNSYVFQSSRSINKSITGIDPTDVCTRGLAELYALYPTYYPNSTLQRIEADGLNYRCYQSNSTFGYANASGKSCPANSSLDGSSCACNSGYKEENSQCVEALTKEQACGVAFYNSGSFTTESVRLEGNVSDGAYCQEMGDSIKPGLACAMRFDKGMAWKTDDGKWHSEGTLQPQIIGGKFQPCVPGIDGSGEPPDPEKPPELPKKQDPTCPNGYQGDVGGQTRCIPSYGYNGVNFAPTTKFTEDAKTRTETTTKTECADGKCTTTDTVKVTDKATGQSTTTSNSTTEVDRAWCAKAENKDKCAKNGKPAYSGQETGVSSGSGGNGSGGDGDGDDKGGRCGAKGQPPCKIDETGTPDGDGKFDSLMDKISQDHQQRIDALNSIKSSGDKDTSMGFSGGFQWLQHKACTPWNLGRIPIMSQTVDIDVNICAIEPFIAPVMNFLWILGTLFATVYRVSSVMGAKVE